MLKLDEKDIQMPVQMFLVFTIIAWGLGVLCGAIWSPWMEHAMLTLFPYGGR